MNIAFDDFEEHRRMGLTGTNEHNISIVRYYSKKPYLKFTREIAKRKVYMTFFRRQVISPFTCESIRPFTCKSRNELKRIIIRYCNSSLSEFNNNKIYSIEGDIKRYKGIYIQFYEQKGVGYKGDYRLITGYLNKEGTVINLYYRGYSFFGIRTFLARKKIKEKLFLTIDDSKKVNSNIAPKSGDPIKDRLTELGLYQEKKGYRFLKLLIKGLSCLKTNGFLNHTTQQDKR